MVQAILAGRKTMTRRVVKFPKDYAVDGLVYDNYPYGLKYNSTIMGGTVQRLEPRWKVGDVLWVRERWRKNEIPTGFAYHFYADDDYRDKDAERWKPSIHMPRKACRLFLKVVDVRAERLHDIKEQDALKEGIIEIEKDEAYFDYMGYGGTYAGPIGSFYSLWQKINGKESLDANPWVWVIEFEREEMSA
jgi:hypothetical protein